MTSRENDLLEHMSYGFEKMIIEGRGKNSKVQFPSSFGAWEGGVVVDFCHLDLVAPTTTE